jgi:hydrogenase maturation protein HypF
LQRGFNAPITTSMGRLFDAVASLIGLRHRASFEGQAAMNLEWIVDTTDSDRTDAFALVPAEPPGGPTAVRRLAARDARWHADWGPIIDRILLDLRAGQSAAPMAAYFHRALIGLMVEVANRAGLERVALSGGCFQNALLLQGAVTRLREAGHRVYWHQRVPTNDGGLALGQVVGALGAEAADRRRKDLNITGP